MSSTWRPLAQLVCGAYQSHGELGQALNALGATIDNAIVRLKEIGKLDLDYKRVAAAFYSRALLEATCSVMVARIDPFRVLIVRNIQQQPDYRLDVRSRSAIEWSDDVMSKGPLNPVWSHKHPFDKYDRALFGEYYSQVFWAPALKALVDDSVVQSTKGSDWLTQLIGWTPEQFCDDNRATGSRLFSSLSKGVHQEFVVGLSAQYDEPTVSQLVLDTVKFCAALGLISHKLVPQISALGTAQAVEMFMQTEAERYGT